MNDVHIYLYIIIAQAAIPMHTSIHKGYDGLWQSLLNLHTHITTHNMSSRCTFMGWVLTPTHTNTYPQHAMYCGSHAYTHTHTHTHTHTAHEHCKKYEVPDMG